PDYGPRFLSAGPPGHCRRCGHDQHHGEKEACAPCQTVQAERDSQVPGDEEEVVGTSCDGWALLSKLTRTRLPYPADSSDEAKASDLHAAIPFRSTLPIDRRRGLVGCARSSRGNRKAYAFRDSEDFCNW